MTSIRELQARAYHQSAEKGFHDGEPAIGDPGWLENDAMKIALMHSELSEGLEELRSGRNPAETYYHYEDGDETSVRWTPEGNPRKPEGLPSELADEVIRVMDYCEARGIDLEDAIIEKLDYNATRARMHGGRQF